MVYRRSGSIRRNIPLVPMPGAAPPSSFRRSKKSISAEEDLKFKEDNKKVSKTTSAFQDTTNQRDSFDFPPKGRDVASNGLSKLQHGREERESTESSTLNNYKKKYEKALKNNNDQSKRSVFRTNESLPEEGRRSSVSDKSGGYKKKSGVAASQSRESHEIHRNSSYESKKSLNRDSAVELQRENSIGVSSYMMPPKKSLNRQSGVDEQRKNSLESKKSTYPESVSSYMMPSQIQPIKETYQEKVVAKNPSIDQQENTNSKRVDRARAIFENKSARGNTGKSKDKVKAVSASIHRSRSSEKKGDDDERVLKTKLSQESSGHISRNSGLTGKEIGLPPQDAVSHRISMQSDFDAASVMSTVQKVALIGASGMTGSRFLHSALDAGYQVQCLPSDDPRQTSGTSIKPWKILQVEMEDTQQLEILLSGASFVVVMVNDLLPKKNSEYPALFLTRLVGKLYALMRREGSMQTFLFQSTSLSSNVTGQTPVLSKVVKKASRRKDHFIRDLDSVMKKIAVEHCLRPIANKKDDENEDPNPVAPRFSFLVTRPTILLQNGPGCKSLFASKSQPGPVPISHVDLAEFTLSALTTPKLYNSSPYVVADCF